MPAFLSSVLRISFTKGTQPPQPVPALVHFLSVPRSVKPSAIAVQRSALETLLQEQICAVSGKLSTPNNGAVAPSLGGTNKSSGWGGRTILFCTSCRRLPYAESFYRFSMKVLSRKS